MGERIRELVGVREGNAGGIIYLHVVPATWRIPARELYSTP